MTRYIAYLALALAAAVLCEPSTASADPYGPAFRVNGYTSGIQTPLHAASNARGDSVVVWADTRGTFMKRYDGAGRPQSLDQQIGTSTREVAVDANGNIATLGMTSGVNASLVVTVRDRAGQVIVPEFRVNDTVSGVVGNVGNASMAMNSRGQIVVVWRQTWGAVDSVFARTYHANGSPITGQTLVAQANSYHLDVAMDADGDFIVTWYERRPGTESTYDVRARGYAINGQALSSAFVVNAGLSGSSFHGRIAANSAGTFIIAWVTSAAEMPGAVAQRFDPSGVRIGARVHIIQASTSWHSLAIAENGSFGVAWGTTTSGALHIRARTFTNSGAPIGDSFAVSTGPSSGALAQMAMDAAGNFFVAWRQEITTTDFDVHMRRYSPAGVPITTLSNDQWIEGLADTQDGWRFYRFSVPPGRTTLDAAIFGGFGDADLYLRWGALPTPTEWDGAPYLDGNDEAVRMLNFPPGDWYIGIHAYRNYSGLGMHILNY